MIGPDPHGPTPTPNLTWPDLFRASDRSRVCICVLAHLSRSPHKSGIPLGAQPNNKDHCIKPRYSNHFRQVNT